MSLYTGRANAQDQYDYDYNKAQQEDEYQGYANNYGQEEAEDDDDDGEDKNWEKGFEKRVEGDDDIFVFKKVELPGIGKNEEIKKFVASEQTRIAITKNNRIYRWRPKVDPQFKLYQVPETGKQNFLNILGSKQKHVNIRNVFMDPRGHHCILVGDVGNNYYLNIRQSKIRVITSLKGKTLRTLAFYSSNDQRGAQDKFQLKSGNIVLSEPGSVISLLSLEISQGELVQSYTQNVLSYKFKSDILAIDILKLNQNANANSNQQSNRYVILLLATVSSISCLTGPDDIGILFKKYQNQRVRESQMPRGIQSIIKVCYSKVINRPTKILWTNGNMFLLFKVPGPNQKITDNILSKNETLKFAKKVDLPLQKAYQITDNPINIGVTDFHYYILFQESLTIMSLVTQKIVHYEDFKGMLMSDMTYVQNTGQFWVYEPKGVVKLNTSREGEQAWKLLIAQKNYEEAYNVCKSKNEHISYAAGLYGDDLFNKKKYTEAAQLYSETTRSFEQVFLKFLQLNSAGARDGLIIYLYSWLNKLQPDEKIQKCLLISWLIELIVYDLNNLEKDKGNFQGQKSIQTKNKLNQRKSELEKLLDNNLDIINQNLVYLIMMSHGRIQNLINFADKKGNIEMIIIHYLSEQNYDNALDYLKKVKDTNKVAEVVYKYAHIFFRFQTQKTVNLLLRSIKDFKPIKLMPGLMNIPTEKRSYGIDLLTYCVEELRSKDKSLHNILIFFYATSGKDKIPQLIEQMRKGRLDFDLDFGLRLFKNYKISQAQIIVYGKMYLYSKAVSLALENNKQELAIEYAEKPDYQDERKKLWIDIAKHYLLNKNNSNMKDNMDQVLELTKRSKFLKIQDLLPYFNQNIKIQTFKQQICESLKTYSDQINRLKQLMDKYSTNADQLKNQHRLIKNRCIEVDTNQQCSQCYKILFNTECYIFPCLHGFHKDCLFQSVKTQPTFNRYKVEKISVLNDQIRQIKMRVNRKREQQQRSIKDPSNSSFSIMNALNMSLFSNKKQEENGFTNLEREQAELKVKRDEIDSILAAECIYCGPGIVDTITMPFDNTALRDSWKI